MFKENINRLIEKIGFIEFRKYVYDFINILPKTDCSIGEWVEKTNETFKKADVSIELKIKKKGKKLDLDQLFGAANKQIVEKDFRLGTIHSIKGETFEAVLVILKTKGIGSPYKTLLQKNVKIEDNEELRIVYVGITRPRRLLVLAVPDQATKTAWEEKLLH